MTGMTGTTAPRRILAAIAAGAAVLGMLSAPTTATADQPLTVVDYFKARGATSAVKILTDPMENPVLENVTLGDPKDASSIDNLLKSFDYIREGNRLRGQEGLPPLQVSDTLMAVGISSADYAAKQGPEGGHPSTASDGENLAWGSDPYRRWYDKEKADYEANTPGAVTGHYLNIVNIKWKSTGYGIATNNIPWTEAHAQEFEDPYYNHNYLDEGRVMDVDAYEADVRAWLASSPKPQVDRSLLDAAITKATGYTDPGDGSGEWSRFRTALADARRVRADGAATQSQVDAAAQRLQQAMAALDALTPGHAVTFVDVTDETAHAADVRWLAEQGISTGWVTARGVEFRGNLSVVRQDMAAFLYRMAGSPAFTPDWSHNPFNDVTPSTPHAKEVMWLASTGITTGWRNPDGSRSFHGDWTVVRQDMAAFLHRYATMKGITGKDAGNTVFNDVTDATPHADDIRWMAANGVAGGYQNMTYGGVDYAGMHAVVRQDMAAFLHRLANLR